MSTPLHQCGSCNVSFTMNDFAHLIAVAPKTVPNGILQRTQKAISTLLPLPNTPSEVHPESLVFTCCKPHDEIAIHVFDKKCLSSWVNQSKENCPSCRAPIYKHQLGKTVTQLLDIFLTALKEDKEIVSTTLLASEHENDECAVCCNDLAIIPLRFDPETQRLYHDQCGLNNPQLYIRDLAKIASKVINKYPHLKAKYTPIPLTFVEKLIQDYPLTARVVVLSAISIGAFVLNRNKFGGDNWPLFILGFPVYVTLVGVHQIGLLWITLRNLRRAT